MGVAGLCRDGDSATVGIMRTTMLLPTLLLALASASLGCPSSAPAPVAPTPDHDNNNGDAPEPASGEPTSAGVVDGEIVLSRPIEFVPGSDDLAPSSDEILAPVLGLLNDRADLTLIRIEGHLGADSGADDEIETSGQRAFAVARWLHEHGVACERLLATAFGSSKPIAANDTVEGRAANTRVSLHIATLRGVAVGGMPVDGSAAAADDPCP